MSVQSMRVTRAYVAGFGTAGSLLAGASVLFVLATAVVSFRGWPQVADVGPAPALVLSSKPTYGVTASIAKATRGPVTVAATPRALTAAVLPASPRRSAAPAQHQTTTSSTIASGRAHGVTVRPSRPPSTSTTPLTTTTQPTACTSSCATTPTGVGAVGAVATAATGSIGAGVTATGKQLGNTVAGVGGALASQLSAASPAVGGLVAGVGQALGAAVGQATGAAGSAVAGTGQLLGGILGGLGGQGH